VRKLVLIVCVLVMALLLVTAYGCGTHVSGARFVQLYDHPDLDVGPYEYRYQGKSLFIHRMDRMAYEGSFNHVDKSIWTWQSELPANFPDHPQPKANWSDGVIRLIPATAPTTKP
jgi:hypothetical protein